jgi:hypothetical protein
MSILDQLAAAQGVRGDGPNIALAEALATWRDESALAAAVGELVNGLNSRDRRQQSDCLKTLYELGERCPAAIAAHVDAYARLLLARNNRLVWGGMAALAASALARPEALMTHLPLIQRTLAQGSVITVDKAILALARLAASSDERRAALLPSLIVYLRTVRPTSLAMYSDFVAAAATGAWASELAAVLRARLPDLTPPQARRVARVLRALEAD